MRLFLACVWELLLLVVLVQATSNDTLNDKHICIRRELLEHEGKIEIPMKKSDAENCVDPSSCMRRVQGNRLRWFDVPRCCPGYKPTPHLKELVCVSACPDGCPEFARCLSRGTCVCKSGLQTVSRTPLVCVSPTTMAKTTTFVDGAANTTVHSGGTVKSSPSSPPPNLTTSDGDNGPLTSLRPTTVEELPPVTWPSSPPSPDDTGVVESKLPEYFRQEMESIDDMSSAAFTTGGELLTIWVIFLLHILAGRN